MSTPPENLSHFTFRLLRAGAFKLDAGSMFGLIPRTVWSRSVPTDDRNRMSVQHNCLLLERSGPAAPGVPSRVLIETGTGDKLDQKMRDVFSLENRSILTALAEVNVAPESIDAVIVSHLHFDHAGGLTRLVRTGEKPTWPCPPNDDGGGGSSQTGGCVPSFPNAKVYIQEREWNDAVVNRSVMTKTYYPDHIWPIAAQIVKIDSPRPYPTGITPDRDELPKTPIEYRETQLWTGAALSVFLVPGHTWGQQAVKFQEPPAPRGKGRTIVFTPDVMPTRAHNGSAYSLAYDVEPYTSMLTRRWLLTEAARNDWVLCLDHEPGHPLVRVRENTKGWFDLIDEPE